MVDVLFCERGGPYFDLLGEAHCWDRERDAMTYAGSGPVICHPECGPYSKLRHLYKGHDTAHAPFSIGIVRRCGGVLEHPAGSLLWEYPLHIDDRTLPRPGEFPDEFGGYTIEVDQCAWGHVARKKSWLYLVGVPKRLALTSIRTGGTPTHWISGFRTSTGRNPKHYKSNGCAVPPGIKVCSAQQRRRTPVEFARWLIALAEQAGKPRAA